MRRGDSVLSAPGLGQCCLYRVQLFTVRLQLDPKQRCVCAVAGFLRQRGRDCEPTPPSAHPTSSLPHLDQGGTPEKARRWQVLAHF